MVFIQELQRKEEQIGEMQRMLQKLKWNSAFDASRIKETGLQSGVAILWRQHIDIWTDEEPVIAESRVLAAHWRHPAWGVINEYSVCMDQWGHG